MGRKSQKTTFFEIVYQWKIEFCTTVCVDLGQSSYTSPLSGALGALAKVREFASTYVIACQFSIDRKDKTCDWAVASENPDFNYTFVKQVVLMSILRRMWNSKD